MLTRNRIKDPQQPTTSALVNGSRGVVVSFIESVNALTDGSRLLLPRVRFDNGVTTTVGHVAYSLKDSRGTHCLTRIQVPIKLAWAVTVHRSQGSTLSRAELMLSNSFEFGMAYVALSRVTSLKGLWLTQPISRNKIQCSPKVLQFYLDRL